MKVRDIGIEIGDLSIGSRNSLTDIKGVKVGHCTLNNPRDVKTGVTAIMPHEGNLYKEKIPGYSFVMNGYGKSLGLMQMNELGNIETPIILTNTLSVGTAFNALVNYSKKVNEEKIYSVNPIVLECNDCILNKIEDSNVQEKHVQKALKNVKKDFEEGCVGAGTGMTALGFKGGIGTSSRVIEIGDPQDEYTVGSIVLSNFGRKKDLTITGVPIGNKLKNYEEKEGKRNSIVMVTATDAPLSSRQLKRVAKRAILGLGRTGSKSYNGSGDISVAFSTSNKIKDRVDFSSSSDTKKKSYKREKEVIEDSNLDKIFKATVESTEEAILNSLFQAQTTKGREGKEIRKIPIKEIKELLKKE